MLLKTKSRICLLLICCLIYAHWHYSLRFKKIIIHCTASEYGNRAVINWWHLDRGWSEIGYNYVILNKNPLPYILKPEDDGKIEIGRSLLRVGSHTKWDNYDSIGITLIGIKDFTDKQLLSLNSLIKQLMIDYGISSDFVYGHYEMRSGIIQKKTCPNLDMDLFRQELGR